MEFLGFLAYLLTKGFSPPCEAHKGEIKRGFPCRKQRASLGQARQTQKVSRYSRRA